jgi:hypothetical protein
MEGVRGRGGRGRGNDGLGGWAAASVDRWPKFWPKSLKGAGEKKSWLEEFVTKNWPNFFPNWPNFFHVLAGK